MEVSTSQPQPSRDDPKPDLLPALPNELISAVICEVASLRDVANLVLTCRALYENFSSRKHYHLVCVIQNSLGPVAPTAAFLSRHGYNSARVYESHDPVDTCDRISYLAHAHSCFINYNSEIPFSTLAREDRCNVMEVCTDLRAMEFLTNLFIETRLRSFRPVDEVALPSSITEKQRSAISEACAQPSNTERLRVLRAFYRRQFICNVWAPTERVRFRTGDWWYGEEVIAVSNTVVDEVDEDSSDIARPLGLLEPFEEWEQQQIDHVNVFVSRLCAALWIAADAHKDPVQEDLIGDMMSKATSLVKYIHDHELIANDAIAHVALLPKCSSYWFGLNRPREDPPYHQLIGRYFLPFFTSVWQRHRSDVCPNATKRLGSGCRFTVDALDSPPFGWIDAFGEWRQHWAGRELSDDKAEMDDIYKELSDMYWPHHYALGVCRVGGLTMWDQRRVRAIPLLPQLMNPWLVSSTGWAIEHFHGGSRFWGIAGWDGEFDYGSNRISDRDGSAVGGPEEAAAEDEQGDQQGERGATH